MLDGEGVPEIHPADLVPMVWLIAGLLLLAVCIASPFVVRWWSRRRARMLAARRPNTHERLRAEHLAEVDRISEQWRAGQLPAGEAVQQASVATRRFVGTMLDEDVDFMTLQELEQTSRFEPRIKELLTIVEDSYPVSFANENSDLTAELLDRFRAVIQRWS